MTVKRPKLLRALPFLGRAFAPLFGIAFAPLLLTLCLPLAAFADGGYVSVPDIAKANGMQYKDLSEGDAHVGKLVGNGQKIILYAGQWSILINDTATRLSRPVRWNGGTLEVPEEAVDLLTGKAQPPAAADETPTPEPATPVKARTRPVGGKVVIDPGHGGHDHGTMARAGDLNEKDIVLEVALAVGARLRSQGVTVVFTRKSDVFIKLSDRVAIANRENPDLFLSIHVNADARTDLRGASVYYPAAGALGGFPGLMERAEAAVEGRQIKPESFGAGGPVGRTALLAVTEAAFEGYRLRSIQAARCLLRDLSPVTGHIDRDGGLIEDFRSLRVLRETHCPAVLCEMDFLSNRLSERKLNTQSYRAAIAQAISEGVMDFLAECAPEGAAR